MEKVKDRILYVAWTVALIGVLGSLYFSDVRHFPPCVLCWYQRIFLYPLVFIIGAGILRRDKKLYQYVLPMSLSGLGVSIYHNLLYYNLISGSTAPCLSGVSCTTKFIEYFGFITIPFLSLCAFVFITLSVVIHWKLNYEN